MKYSHWDLLLSIYQYNNLGDNTIKLQKDRCHKTLIKTCIKNGWVKEYGDGTVEVTEKGMEDSKEYAALYKKDLRQIGQTY